MTPLIQKTRDAFRDKFDAKLYPYKIDWKIRQEMEFFLQHALEECEKDGFGRGVDYANTMKGAINTAIKGDCGLLSEKLLDSLSKEK